MYLLSQLWIYLLIACGVGALIGALCYRYCRRGRMQDELRNLRLQADTETATLRSRLADVDGQRAQAVERLTLLDTQFETLRTSSERSLESFADRIRDLDTNLHRREAQMKSAEARAAAEATTHAQTRARLQEITDELRRVESAHSAAAQERDQFNAELGSLREDIVGARGMMQEINAAAKSREDVLRTELIEMRRQLDDAAASSAAAVQAERIRQMEYEGRAAALGEELQASRKALSEAGQSIAAFQQREDAAEADRTMLRQQLAEINARFQQAEENESLLRNQLSEHNQSQFAKGDELKSLRAELTVAREALAGLRQREQAMATENSDLRRQLVELSAKLKEAGTIEIRLREETQRLTQRDTTGSEELTRVRRELEEVRNSVRIAKSREQTLLAEISEMRARASGDRNEVERLSSELKRAMGSQERPSNRNFKPSIVASMDADDLEKLVLAAGEGHRPVNAVGSGVSDYDDLKEIGGIGPVNEKWLHAQGIFYFWQIASWVPEELAWVAQNLPNFGTRVYRENWVAQAMRLARGEMTDAKRKYKDGKHR